MRKSLILIHLVLASYTIQAQTWYEAKYSTEYTYSDANDEYYAHKEEWKSQRFAIDKEYIILEFTPNEYSKFWWAKFEDETSKLDCYYTENDEYKICLDFDDNEVLFFTDSEDGQFQNAWVISKIAKLD